MGMTFLLEVLGAAEENLSPSRQAAKKPFFLFSFAGLAALRAIPLYYHEGRNTFGR
jgi:hypothetical protein